MANPVETILTHPLVLQAAWKRVRSWYHFGEWAPPAELEAWNLEAGIRLVKLGHALASDELAPSPFRLIPYPKKGGILRHYTMPSIRDQVAFAVFGVLLAPILELRMPNFSFGNRWYRQLYRKLPPIKEQDDARQLDLFAQPQESNTTRPIWSLRPFAITDRKMYQPYARGHGLFRRVAHWSAAAMLRVPVTDTAATDAPKDKRDYAPEALPPFASAEWWRPEEGDEVLPAHRHAYYVHLDFQLAYPSVRLDYLGHMLNAALGSKVDSDRVVAPFGIVSGEYRIREALKAYPKDVMEVLCRPEARLELAARLLALLQKVKYVDINVPDDHSFSPECTWRPAHAYQSLPGKSGHVGLPTGLAISGLLMNTYLLDLDSAMSEWMISKKGEGKPAAFLRFADDMILISPQLPVLAEGIDALWTVLCRSPVKELPESPHPVISQPSRANDATNLHLNWAKVEPNSVSATLNLYLRDEGWDECSTCKRLLPRQIEKDKPSNFAEWVRRNEEQLLAGTASVDYRELKARLHEEAIKPSKLNPFLAYIVEHLSALSRESLLTRFGPQVQERLVQLHELVRFDLNDKQVREDTRQAFAANRLAKAWLPEKGLDEDRVHLEQIRRSIQIALAKAPWKFSLWRAVVQAAVRRPPGRADDGDQKRADEWLRQMLRLIAVKPRDPAAPEDHMDLEWSTDGEHDGCWEGHPHPPYNLVDSTKLRETRNALIRSHLRASFWRAIGEVVRELKRLHGRLRQGDKGGVPSWEWPSDEWTFRALSEAEVEGVLAWISRLDEWERVLYDTGVRGSAPELTSWWWESESIAVALLATTDLADLSESASMSTQELSPPNLREDFVNAVLVPSELVFSIPYHIAPRLRLLLKTAVHAGRRRKCSFWFDAALCGPSGRSTDSICAALVASAQSKRNTDWERTAVMIAVARRLSLALDTPRELIESIGTLTSCLQWVGTASAPLERLRRLYVYKEARYLRLSCMEMISEHLPQKPTLYRLLWGGFFRGGKPFQGAGLSRWPLSPCHAPAVGLPVRLAVAMLSDALSQELEREKEEFQKPADASLPIPAVWQFESRIARLLARGRRIQLGFEEFEHRGRKPPDKPNAPWIQLGRSLDAWEIMPHPAFYLPWAIGMGEGGSLGFQAWGHLLQFYTAVEGSEDLLNALFDRGPGSTPFAERWDLRGRIPLPPEVWEQIERSIRLCGFGFEAAEDVREVLEQLLASLALVEKSVPPVSIHDFRWERADIRLDLNRSFEIPQAVLPFAHTQVGYDQPQKEFRLSRESLRKEIFVRLGQLRSHPDWADVIHRFPALRRSEIQAVMGEVWAVLFSQPHHGSSLSQPNIVLLPEVTIPRSEVVTIIRTAASLDIGIFAGLFWRVVPTAARPHRSIPNREFFIVNDAILAVPLRLPGDDGPALARYFLVEKPVPASVEHGLALALGENGESSRWRMLSGRRWYRFVHPEWGDFTVAICSDLLDSSPWVTLRSKVLHLFMCAYNKDVDLYEALTWVRAYENYANVASVNHGDVGGSFAWTPRRGGRNELAKLRGSSLLLTADIKLPVKDLWEQQVSGVRRAAIHAKEKWLSEHPPRTEEFKSPPPDFPSRKDSGED